MTKTKASSELGKEARRLEESAIYSAKGHFNASDQSRKRYYSCLNKRFRVLFSSFEPHPSES